MKVKSALKAGKIMNNTNQTLVGKRKKRASARKLRKTRAR